MSTNHTPNFNLCQWEATDKVLRTDFNHDNQKIDAALAGLQQSKGNCRIVTGSYVGAGTYNQYGANSLSFDGKPLALLVQGSPLQFVALYGTTLVAVLGGSSVEQVNVAWQEHAVTWKHGDSPNYQLNQKDTTYRYVVLLAAD